MIFSGSCRQPRSQVHHQLPVGAVGVRHRLGCLAQPERHRLLPCATASFVRVDGDPGWRDRRGARIALSRGLDPDRFAEEVRRYGVTVVSYTWTMMREILDAKSLPWRKGIRSGCSSGRECRPGSGGGSLPVSRRRGCSSSTHPPRVTWCWSTSRARRSARRDGRCRQRGGTGRRVRPDRGTVPRGCARVRARV